MRSFSKYAEKKRSTLIKIYENTIVSSFIYTSINLETIAKNMFDCHVPLAKKNKQSRLFYQERETLRFNIIDFDSSQMLALNRLIMKLGCIYLK